MSDTKNPAAVELGRLGGKAKSERKTASSRMNAKRPRKPQPTPEPENTTIAVEPVKTGQI